MTRSETVIFRCRPEERAVLVEVQKLQGLPSLSEAARAVIRQAAADRRRLEVGGQREVAQYEPD